MDLTKESIELIQDTSTAAKRATLIKDSSGVEHLYDDSEQKYFPLARFVKQEGAVSTVESLVDLVEEFAKRTGRKTGKTMTVTFTSKGATFSPDDDDRRHSFTYGRVLSQQWVAFRDVISKQMTHKGLIRTLQALSPSIIDYPRIFALFQRLAISKDVKLVSEPVLNSGSSENSYRVNLSIKGAHAGETDVPSQIEVRIQYARGSSAFYTIPVEVDLADNDGTPVITLFAPTIDAVADQAVLDELTFFKSQADLRGLTELLTVVNF